MINPLSLEVGTEPVISGAVLDPRIYFILVVPDGAPHEATPTQGFAPSLCWMSWAIRAAALMPTTIYELTEAGQKTLLARRMSGTSPVNWYGQTPRAIRDMPIPDPIPFTVIILPESESPEDYREWLAQCKTQPTIIAKEGGHLSEISLEALQKRFLAVCDSLPSTIDAGSIESAKEAIASWQPMPTRQLSYQVGGHNTVLPNITALSVAGYDDMVFGRFNDFNSGLKPYVDQIVKTTNSVFDERKAVGHRDMQRIYRRPPDLNLFSPAFFPQFLR